MCPIVCPTAGMHLTDNKHGVATVCGAALGLIEEVPASDTRRFQKNEVRSIQVALVRETVACLHWQHC